VQSIKKEYFTRMYIICATKIYENLLTRLFALNYGITKRLERMLPESNRCIKRKENDYLLVKSFLTVENLFVFYEGTTTTGIPLNDEKFGML